MPFLSGFRNGPSTWTPRTPGTPAAMAARAASSAAAIQPARNGERIRDAIEGQDLEDRLEHRPRANRREKRGAGCFGAGDKNVRTALNESGGRLFDTAPGLIGLAKQERRKAAANERHRAVAKLGRAERLRMKLRCFLELE